MTRKRNLQTSIYLALRHMGMLCKTPKSTPRKIHIQKTIHPDGSIIIYDAPLDESPKNSNSFQSELGAFLANKKLAKVGCTFDVQTQSCSCGKTTDEFLKTSCNDKN